MSLYRVTLKKCVYEDIYVSAKNIKEAREYMNDSDLWNSDFKDYQFDSITKIDHPSDVDDDWVDGDVYCFGFHFEDVNVWQAFYGIYQDELSDVIDDKFELALDKYLNKIQKAKDRFLKERDRIKSIRLKVK